MILFGIVFYSKIYPLENCEVGEIESPEQWSKILLPSPFDPCKYWEWESRMSPISTVVFRFYSLESSCCLGSYRFGSRLWVLILRSICFMMFILVEFETPRLDDPTLVNRLLTWEVSSAFHWMIPEPRNLSSLLKLEVSITSGSSKSPIIRFSLLNISFDLNKSESRDTLF